MQTKTDTEVPRPRAAPDDRMPASHPGGAEPRGRTPPLTLSARMALVCGLLILVSNLVQALGWHMNWTAALKIREAYPPLAYTSAVALALTGLAIATRARGSTRWLKPVGVVDLLLGAGSMAKIAFTWDRQVDEFLLSLYIGSAPQQPSRMAINTAVCLVAIGIAFLVWDPKAAPWRRAAPTAAAAIAGSIAVVALFGYLAGEPHAYGWHRIVPMSPAAAVSMVVVAAGLMTLAFATRPRTDEPFSSWIAVPAGTAAFGITLLLWKALLDMGPSTSIAAPQATHAVLFLVLLTGGMLPLMTWLVRHANRGREVAVGLADQLRSEVDLRTRAETVARDSEALLFRFLDALPVGVYVTKPDGTTHYVNRHATALLDLRDTGADASAREQPPAVGLPSRFLIDSDTPYPVELSPMVRALAGEQSHVDDMEIHRPDGAVVPVEVWGTPVLGDAGEVRFGMAAFVDTTERRASAQALVRSAALLDLARDAIYFKDPDGRITYWNRGAEAAYGWTAEEAVGAVVRDLLRTEYPEPVEAVDDALQRDGHWNGELVQHTKAGDRRIVLGRLVAEARRDGRIQTVMAINTDITARKEAEAGLAHRVAELRELNLELVRSNDELEQFAYIASHDLSEPLRAIAGPISLLGRRYRGRLDDDADSYIDFAVAGCERMQVLINDLLAFSRVGRVEIPKEPVDTNALLKNVLASLRPVLEARSVELRCDDLPAIKGEATLLGQLFQNLIANAVKFTAPEVRPCVHVGAERVGDHWRFCVTDNGIGIDENHRERIFGMFKRLHTRDAYPGTGIGLAVCKKIVERHGGTIGVSDGPGSQGTTFWFQLPLGQEDSS